MGSFPEKRKTTATLQRIEYLCRISNLNKQRNKLSHPKQDYNATDSIMRVNSEVKKCYEDISRHFLSFPKYHILLKVLTNTHTPSPQKKLKQNNWHPDRDYEPGLHEYEGDRVIG
jgi:DNA mismatch repair ATPase MutS